MIYVLIVLVLILITGPRVAKSFFAPYMPATYLGLILVLIGLVLLAVLWKAEVHG
jgi:hypothetical protein